MWQLVDSLSRPTLQQHLLARACDYRRIAAETLGGSAGPGTDPADPARRLRLLAAFTGLDACWQVLGPSMPGPLRRRLRRNRRALQDALGHWRVPDLVTRDLGRIQAMAGLGQEVRGGRARRALGRLAARCVVPAAPDGVDTGRLGRLLEEQDEWLDVVARRQVDDADVQAAIVRIYARARRAARRDPAAARTRRKLMRLIGVLELIDPQPGPTTSGTALGPGVSLAGDPRRLLRTLRELRDLEVICDPGGRAFSGLRPADRRLLAKPLRRRRKRLLKRRRALQHPLFQARPTDFARELRWLVFAGLARSGYVDR